MVLTSDLHDESNEISYPDVLQPSGIDKTPVVGTQEDYYPSLYGSPETRCSDPRVSYLPYRYPSPDVAPYFEVIDYPSWETCGPYEEWTNPIPRTSTPNLDQVLWYTRSNGETEALSCAGSPTAAFAAPSVLGGGGSGMMPHLSQGTRYECKRCPYWTPISHELERHAKLTGHRTYKCPESGCDGSFTRRDTFVRHLATHRKSSGYICPKCLDKGQRKPFRRKDALRQHMRNSHPETSPPSHSSKPNILLQLRGSLRRYRSRD